MRCVGQLGNRAGEWEGRRAIAEEAERLEEGKYKGGGLRSRWVGGSSGVSGRLVGELAAKTALFGECSRRSSSSFVSRPNLFADPHSFTPSLSPYTRLHALRTLFYLPIGRRLLPVLPLLFSQVEYMVISYDDATKNARLSLRQTEILNDLQADAAKRREASRASSPAQLGEGEVKKAEKDSCIPVFHPEYGRYMLESTPGEPYGATLEDLLDVEGNMRFRCVFLSPFSCFLPPAAISAKREGVVV
jgi:hypothetical protein